MLINLRNALMAEKALPYKKRLEYISSTGSRYIDTGMLIKPTHVVTLDLQYNTTRPPDNAAMQNGLWDTRSGQPYIVFSSQSNIFYGYTSNYRRNGCNAGPSNTNRHLVTFDLAGDGFYLDGVKSLEFGAGIEKISTVSFYLFARNLRGSGAQHFCSEKLYGFSIAENGVNQMNLIPVLDLTGEAKMFDEVTQTYPAHYGTFTPGPEI